MKIEELPFGDIGIAVTDYGATAVCYREYRRPYGFRWIILG